MLTCKFQHGFCADCYTKQGLENKISCKYCAFFFEKPNRIVCLFCKRVRLNAFQFECGDCSICEFCMHFIKENNLIRYIQSISCQEGQFNLCKLLEIPLDFLIDDKQHLETLRKGLSPYNNTSQKIYCKKCRTLINFFDFCDIHPFCKKCFNDSPIEQHFGCEKCKIIFQAACKKCFSIIRVENEKIENLACKKIPKDFYCSVCFVDIKHCMDCFCSSCLLLYESGSKNICYLCKRYDNRLGDFWCSKHKLCLKCQFKSDYALQIYKNTLGCEDCKKNSMMESFKPNYQIAKLKNSNFDSDEDKIQESIEKDQFKSALIESSQTFSGRKLTVKNNYIVNEDPKNLLTGIHSIRNNNYFAKNNKVDSIQNNLEKINLKYESSVDIAEKPNTDISVKNHGNYLDFALQEKNFTDSSNLVKGQNDLRGILNPIEKTNENLQVRINEIVKVNSKENDIYTVCCGQNVKKNECGHPICMQCLGKLFEKKFNYFICLILEENLEVLNNTSWEIGCFKEECYLKACFPFSLFQDIANRIVIDKKLHEKMSTHFDLYFEGIKYYFYKCTNCNFYTGNRLGEGCMWCLKIS
ncbi:hypothetical protein SteCoe_13367 [Stentor coeruleus]|uniref:RING-type domain-containing protein n=1 Tax=Stentor coeruleus TaxID=5963 RepID=A0A1R2C8J2_9CILI|nr:hypothetical protein SteCoe_13367 [Stentor coeruleus]